MTKWTVFLCLAALTGAALFAAPDAARAQCACECIDVLPWVDGKESEECCTNLASPFGPGTVLNAGVCGCVDTGAGIVVNGRVGEDGFSGCVTAGDTDTNELTGEETSCRESGLEACRRLPQCTTVFIDSSNCP